MLKSLSGLINGLLVGLLKFALIVVGFIVVFFVLLFLINWLYMRVIRRDKMISLLPRHPIFRIKNENVIKNFFITFPQRVLKDNFNPDRNYTYPFGTFCFIGKKGSGKTMGMMRYARLLLRIYPDLEIAGNLTVTDPELKKIYTYCSNVKELFKVKNSKNHRLEDGSEIIYPMLKMIDEVSLSVKSNAFGGRKNEEVDEELLAAIANQRKEKELYLYTVQRFHRGNKKLREQVDKVYKCFNIGGWMWCFPYVLVDDKSQENTVDLKRVHGCFNYVQTQELRDSYDTRELITDFVEGGLKSSDTKDED